MGKRASRGEARAWLLAHLDHSDQECLYWPFYRGTDGYGEIGWDDGRKHSAHRIINILANGEPPSLDMESAHTCGRGMQGCVNPKHLAWKTHAANQADKIVHQSAARGERHPRAYLSESKILAIREFAHTCSKRTISRLFGISDSYVNQIIARRVWRHI